MKTEVLTIRVSERLKEQIRAQAEREQKTSSEYVLDLIKRDIEKRD